MNQWELYAHQPAMVLGFHGCDAEVGEAILGGHVAHLTPSANEYDWLGGGIYFWEGSPSRAIEFAEAACRRNPKLSRGSIRRPFVLGAILDLGCCCNLLDFEALAELSGTYAALRALCDKIGLEMPVNKGPSHALRFLDRTVVEAMCSLRARLAADGNTPERPRYDSVRGAFVEGEPLYPGAGFNSRTHIQLAIRNRRCIRGYFRPLRPTDDPAAPQDVEELLSQLRNSAPARSVQPARGDSRTMSAGGG